jgi:hypothetical protein
MASEEIRDITDKIGEWQKHGRDQITAMLRRDMHPARREYAAFNPVKPPV